MSANGAQDWLRPGAIAPHFNIQLYKLLKHQSFICIQRQTAYARPLPHKVTPMNYEAFTNDSLTMMYAVIRGSLAADDELTRLGERPRFCVRETPDWKMHATDLEMEMNRRGMTFDLIDWSEHESKFDLTEKVIEFAPR